MKPANQEMIREYKLVFIDGKFCRVSEVPTKGVKQMSQVLESALSYKHHRRER